MKRKTKKCNCRSCKLLRRVRKFENTLTEKQRKVFVGLFGELWDDAESAENDLSILNSKIGGDWPKEDGGEYYTRVGNTLYLIHATKVGSQ